MNGLSTGRSAHARKPHNYSPTVATVGQQPPGALASPRPQRRRVIAAKIERRRRAETRRRTAPTWRGRKATRCIQVASTLFDTWPSSSFPPQKLTLLRDGDDLIILCRRGRYNKDWTFDQDSSDTKKPSAEVKPTTSRPVAV